VLNRLSIVYSRATALARFVPIALALCLAGCAGGVGSQSHVTPPPPPPPGSVLASNFGMQCGQGDTSDCEGGDPPPIVWPTTQAQPGLLRLHDAQTYWAILNPSNGVYDWESLDEWLDLIAQHQPVSVIQVFTWVPCWDSTQGTCGIDPTAPTGTNGYPSDLTAGGSPSFNAFVTAFTQHCSPNNNCVADLIKSYEMWNEWDLSFHWTGTMAQVYQMVKPAAAIIRANVPNAVIMTPSASTFSDTGIGYQADFQNWLNYENANGVISDLVAWHLYLTSTNTSTHSPEDQWSLYAQNFLNIQSSTAGWSTKPWANTETNFDGAPPPGLDYTCPSAQFTPDDCTGQIVRWQLLHASNGASSLDWYKWRQTIGLVPQYETAYYYMMRYLVGGKFSAPCSSTTSGGIDTWTCPFTESNGTSALFVWTPTATGYTVPTGFTDYRDLAGGTTNVTAGQQITIGIEPFMLEM